MILHKIKTDENFDGSERIPSLFLFPSLSYTLALLCGEEMNSDYRY